MHPEAGALEASRNYRRIEHAIRYLDENASRQPGLEEVSREIGLSPFHAQRLFTRYAGFSPKRFLALLTVGHAKTLLQDGRSVPAALHQARSIGEYKYRYVRCGLYRAIRDPGLGRASLAPRFLRSYAQAMLAARTEISSAVS